MNAAQLKEATRAQQGTLLAKIKERQDAVHAAIVANAKEELKSLRAEARKAAGITGEDEEEEEEQGEGGDGQEVEREGEDGKAGEMEVEGMVEREESAVAAAAAAAAVTEGKEDGEEEEEEEEEEDSDFAMREKGVAGPVEKGSASGESSDDSDSDSDDDSEVRFGGGGVRMPFGLDCTRAGPCGTAVSQSFLRNKMWVVLPFQSFWHIAVTSALWSLSPLLFRLEDSRDYLPLVLHPLDMVRNKSRA